MIEQILKDPKVRREYIKLIPKYFFIGLSIRLTLMSGKILKRIYRRMF